MIAIMIPGGPPGNARERRQAVDLVTAKKPLQGARREVLVPVEEIGR